jgi:hypothetical protein
VAGVGLAGAALLVLAGTLTATTVAASALGGVLAVVFSPVGLGIATLAVAAVMVAALVAEFGDLEAIAGSVGSVFNWLAGVFDQTWGGIKASLAAGDLRGAFEIAVQGIKVVWAGLVLALTKGWNRFKDLFVTGMHLAIQEVMLALNKLDMLLGKPDNSEVIRKVTRDNIAQGIRDRARDEREAERDLRRAEIRLEGMARRAQEKVRAAPIEMGPMPREKAAAIAQLIAGMTAGQFGGTGLGALSVASGSVQDKIAKNTEETAKNTKKIADKPAGLPAG